MGRFLRIVLGAVLALSLLAGPAVAYDKKAPDPVPIMTEFKDSFSYPLIAALGTAYGLTVNQENGNFEYREGWWSQRGSGVVVAAGYILTNYHVVNPDTIMLPESQCSSRYTDVIARTSRTVLIFDYKEDPIIGKVLYENPDIDVAIITYNSKKAFWLTPIPYDVVYDPSEIEKGDAVVAVLHERDDSDYTIIESGVQLRLGEVMEPRPYSTNDYLTASLSPFDITLNMAITPGDSGSPLFAFKDGKPYLIGLVRAYGHTPYFYASYACQLPVVWKIIHMCRH